MFWLKQPKRLDNNRSVATFNDVTVNVIPGASEQQMIRLVAVRAACQATGPGRDAVEVKRYAGEFERWLHSSNSETDRAIRFQVLLTVTADLAGTFTEPTKIAKLAHDLHSYIG